MSHRFPPDTPEPPPAISLARVQRQRELAAWHDEWFAGQIAAGVDGPVPPGRPAESDYNLHVPDIEASSSAEDVFHQRARQIMGIR